jgi:hypothetical protein
VSCWGFVRRLVGTRSCLHPISTARHRFPVSPGWKILATGRDQAFGTIRTAHHARCFGSFQASPRRYPWTDRIVVLGRGTIVDEGSHSELQSGRGGPVQAAGGSLPLDPRYLKYAWICRGAVARKGSREALGAKANSQIKMGLEFPLNDGGRAASRGRKHFPNLMCGNLNKRVHNNRVKLSAAACNQPAHGLLMR